MGLHLKPEPPTSGVEAKVLAVAKPQPSEGLSPGSRRRVSSLHPAAAAIGVARTPIKQKAAAAAGVHVNNVVRHFELNAKDAASSPEPPPAPVGPTVVARSMSVHRALPPPTPGVPANGGKASSDAAAAAGAQRARTFHDASDDSTAYGTAAAAAAAACSAPQQPLQQVEYGGLGRDGAAVAPPPASPPPPQAGEMKDLADAVCSGAGLVGYQASGSSAALGPMRRVPTPLQVPLGAPSRRKLGRLHRAWNKFKRMATCANVSTFDQPMQGLPLTPGEVVIDVSRTTVGEPSSAVAYAAALAPAPPTGAAVVASGSVGAPGLATAGEQAQSPRSSSGACSERNDTGYLSTPAQWGRGYLNGAAPAAAAATPPPLPSGGYVSSVGATAGSSVHAPELTGAYGTYGELLEKGSTNGSNSSNRAPGHAGSDNVQPGAEGWAPQGRSLQQYGSQPQQPDRAMQLQQQQQLEGGFLGAAALTARPTPPECDMSHGSLERHVYRAQDSLSGVTGVTSGSGGEEEWYDARSVGSTFSINSVLSLGAAGGAAVLDEHSPPPTPLADAAAAAANVQTDDTGAIKGVARLTEAEVIHHHHQQQQQQKPQAAALPPTTPPQPHRPLAAAPPSWPSNDDSLTGQFSTPVLAHRTNSMTPSGASAVPATVAATADAAAAASPADVPAAAAMPTAVGSPRKLAVVRAPAIVAVPAPAGLRDGERPSYAPEKLVPGLDPATRFVPVPAVTGVAGYWSKIPELSAPIPMPIDLALNTNRMARSVHESIKGILLRETDHDLVLKARLTLPLGLKMTHEEHYHKDNSTHTSMIRRDVRPGRSTTRMYFTEGGDVLLVCESADVAGHLTHTGYELMHVYDNGQMIRCRQWVVILDSGKLVEQYFVGKLSELPHK